MPTDTQRAPTLAQCIEREREAEDARPTHASHCICDRCMAADARIGSARAATDEAVRAVEGGVRLDQFEATMLANLIRNLIRDDERGEAPEYTQAEAALMVRLLVRLDATPAPTAPPAQELEESVCTVDWQHVAKQCSEALDQADDMVTINRGALSLALVAVEQFIGPTPAPTAQGESTGGATT